MSAGSAEIIIRIGRTAVGKHATSLLVGGSVARDSEVFSTADRAEARSRSGVPGYANAAGRAFASQKRPLFALTVVFEKTDTEFSARKIAFDGMLAAFRRAVFRGRVGALDRLRGGGGRRRWSGWPIAAK